MNVKELRKRAAELNITGRSTMDRAELEQAITTAERELESQVGTIVKTMPEDVEFPTVESQHRMAERIHTHTNAPVPKPIGQRVMVRMIRAAQSRRYGQNGRGMGAKQTPDTRPRSYKRDGKQISPDAIKPLSYADRVRHYAVQNGQGLLTANEFPGAMLTPRQWRRAQHKQNANRAFGTKEARYPFVI